MFTFCIIVTVISLLIAYKWFLSWSDKLKHIRQPWSWPFIKHYPYFWNRDQLVVYEELSEPYKEDVPEQVVLLDPEFPKQVLSDPKTFVRSDLLDRVVPFFKNGLLLARGWEAHKWQKKVLSQSFTPEKLKQYMVLSNKHTDSLIQSWMTKDGKNVEILHFLQKFSFAIICEALCSHTTSDDSLKNDFTTACDTVLNLIDNSNTHLLLKLFPFLKRVPFGPGKARMDAINKVDKIMTKIMNERKHEIQSNENYPNDFLSCMFYEQMRNTTNDSPVNDNPSVTREEEKQVMTDKHIRDNLFTFLLGGYETTSTALMWTLYALAIYPDVQTKAREEVTNILNGNEFVTLEHVNAMTYLQNVIKETLRVYNSSIRVGRISTKDCKIGKYFIPKNQMIKTVFNLFHMNQELFPNPQEFRPERFEEDNIKAGSWLAFGYGPYSCIGRKFALNEMKTCLSKLLLAFKFTVDDDKRSFIRTIRLTINASPSVTLRLEKI